MTINTRTEKTLDIIHETGSFLAVNKPANILVIPDQYSDTGKTLLGKVTEYLNSKPFVVHRLDRGTSGVILFAKNAESHTALCTQFEHSKVTKKYLAIINGEISDDSGEIDMPILTEGRKVSISAEGKRSVTEYRVLERFRNHTYVEASPRTGRRHQIRIHFWSIGFPLAVDPEYTKTEGLFLSEFKKKYKPSGIEKPMIGRLSLHSSSISFTDPESGEPMTLSAELPADFEITLKQLRKWS